MIPSRITEYLERNKVPFKRRPHSQAVSAQELAASLHISGYCVAKSVLVAVDGEKWIAVLPAAETVDLVRLAASLRAPRVELLTEADFAPIFPECELGAEPPFGGLYGLPVIVDSALSNAGWIILRAGSHQESLQMAYSDFVALEPAEDRIVRLGDQPGGGSATARDHIRTSLIETSFGSIRLLIYEHVVIIAKQIRLQTLLFFVVHVFEEEIAQGEQALAQLRNIAALLELGQHFQRCPLVLMVFEDPFGANITPRGLAQRGDEPLLFQSHVALENHPELIAEVEQPGYVLGLAAIQAADDQVEIRDHPAQTSVLGEDAKSNIARFHRTPHSFG